MRIPKSENGHSISLTLHKIIQQLQMKLIRLDSLDSTLYLNDHVL